MAEIKIEKKDRKPVWPWIVGIILALIVIWIVVETVDDDNETITRTRTETVGTQQNVADADTQEEQGIAGVDEYSSYIADNADAAEMGMDHEYTANGIRLLSDALSDIVNRVDADVNIQQKNDELRNKADEIQRDPQSTQHANKIRDAFMTSADLMSDLQNNHFQNLDDEVSNVQETAEAVDPNVETLNQKANVQAFFASADQALQQMSARLNQGQTQQGAQTQQDGQTRQDNQIQQDTETQEDVPTY